jgi:hypothetical protein
MAEIAKKGQNSEIPPISGPKDHDPHPRYDLTKALIEITMSVVA